MPRCMFCSTVYPEPSGTGRPAVYCSPGCRRLAQSEKQRITRHLSAREEELMEVRHRIARGDNRMLAHGDVAPEVRERELETDIERLTARLRELFERE